MTIDVLIERLITVSKLVGIVLAITTVTFTIIYLLNRKSITEEPNNPERK